jgi:hypothetical protein
VYRGLTGAVGTTTRSAEYLKTDQRVWCGEVVISIGFLMSILKSRVVLRFAYDPTDDGAFVDVRISTALDPGTWATYTAFCGRSFHVQVLSRIPEAQQRHL